MGTPRLEKASCIQASGVLKSCLSLVWCCNFTTNCVPEPRSYMDPKRYLRILESILRFAPDKTQLGWNRERVSPRPM